jgi:YegS/Rv2252/BmrU family lipid kinase
LGEGIDVHFTSAPGEARQIAAAGLRAGARWLIAAGGDGTASDAANGFFESGKNIWPDVPLSVLPCGSANDFSRALGAPASALSAVESLKEPRERRIDVGWAAFSGPDGRLQERAFLNVAECGVGAEAVDRLSRLPHGRAAYLTMALLSVLSHRLRSYEVAIGGGIHTTTPPSLGILVSNGRFFGAGIPCAPTALPDDGWLDVITLGHFGRLEVLRKIHLLLSGKPLREKKVSHATVSSVEISAGVPTLLEMDGEPVGSLPARIHVLPSALLVRY